MRKQLIISLLLFLPFVSIGQTRKFDKLIEEFDVKEYLTDTVERNPANFWNAVWENNKALNKFIKAINKKKTTAINANRAVNEAMLIAEDYYYPQELGGDWKIVADTVLSRLGIKEVNPEMQLSIIYSDDFNAFVNPNAHIYMADTLFLTDSLCLNNIIGIAAHEVAHSLLFHAKLEAYAVEQKKQKNKIVAASVAALNAAANAYAQANGAVTEESWESVHELTYELFEAAEDDANNRYKFKYSREQEIEADIIAFRFLEYMGIDVDYYINALRFIGKDRKETLKADKKSTHPTMRFRIELLEYLKSR